MLEELTIQNYALIESLTLKFTSGLTIFSGETGAGKSIIIGALGLLLGAKGDPGLIRTGSSETKVSGVIHVMENNDAQAWLEERDIAADDGYVVIRRTVRSAGRGTLSIQSMPVTRSELAEFTSFLFDMHGQHAHQSLLNIDNHRKLLDNYSGISRDVAQLRETFSELSGLKKKQEALKKTERDILIERDMLQHAIQEIDDAELSPGEEEILIDERSVLVQHESLMVLFETFKESLAAESNGALTKLGTAGESLDKIAGIISSADTYRERWNNAFFEIEDIFETLKAMEEEIDYSPERLEECEDRLQLIRRLEKKYGDSIEEVLRYKAEAEKKLTGFENRDADISSLEKQIAVKEKFVLEKAHFISSTRKSRGTILEKEILGGLHKLGMGKASFKISIKNRETGNGKFTCGPTGMDRVEFLISTNEGEPLKPLKAIASGGELSRIMLSIKSVLADSDNISTLVFDEIDTGIGGEVALSVGEHLVSLSRHKQILCITHLASIAVCADSQYKVDKLTEEGRTFTEVHIVSGEERVKEIARMLAGDTEGTASLDHARELLHKYQQ